MRIDLENEEFKAMLSGERGLFALDVARDMKDLLGEISTLSTDLEKWQKEADNRGDKVSVLIDEKTGLQEKYKALKDQLKALVND